MKIFKDHKTELKFSKLYGQLPTEVANTFGQKVRDLRDRKVTSEDGMYDEFYVTEAEVEGIYRSILE